MWLDAKLSSIGINVQRSQINSHVNMDTWWIISTIVMLTEWLQTVDGHDCNSSESIACRDELDNLMLFGRQKNYIEDEKHLDEQCRKQLMAVQCIKTYAESCLPGKQQEIFNILTKGADQFFHDFCNEESELRKEYLKHSACINTVAPELDQCTEQYQTSQKFLDEQEFDVRTLKKQTCCIYFEHIQCSANATVSTCGEVAAQVVTKLWKLLGGTYLNDECEPFEDDQSGGCSPVSKGSSLRHSTNTLYLVFLTLYSTLSYFR
ncbi:uncharacterized protein [Parasteatoda tepidariorum]|uniref:uncharacterized protein n=1 Tax=Parasteatoda tepidariorum TaxID=114398 RepID=UPI00077FE1CE|nr:uncharacterized protein LOC107457083 [Parasteatoda tepidariorum]